MMFLLQRRGSRTHPRPGVGSAIWTGYAPTVTGVTQFASPGVGSATWTGYAPDISKLATLAPGVGAATWTGPAPTVSGLLALPSGALGAWYAKDYDATARAIPNAVTGGTLSSNILRCGQRLLNKTELWGSRLSVTVADEAVTGPGGATDASTLVAAGGSNWYFGPNDSATIPAGTYTFAIKVKRNTGSDQTFGITIDNTGSVATTMTATSSWAWVYHTFTIGSAKAINQIKICASTLSPTWPGASLQIADIQLYAGSAAPADASPDGHLYFGISSRDATPVAGTGYVDLSASGAVGTIQFANSTTFSSGATVIAIAAKVGSGNSHYGYMSKVQSYSTLTAYFEQSGIPYFFCGSSSPMGQTAGLWEANGKGYFAYTCRHDGSNNEVWINKARIIQNASALGTAPAARDYWVGGVNGTSLTCKHRIAAIAMWPRALTLQEQSDAIDWMEQIVEANGITMADERIYVAEGDSITGASSFCYPYKFGPNSSPFAWGGNYGISGSTLANLNSRASTVDAILPIDHATNGRKYILSVLIGANDLSGYASAAAYITDLKSYCSARKTAGWKVYVGTILPIDGGATHNSRRATVNADITANWVSLGVVDGVIDFAADAELGADNARSVYPANWTDATHPNTTGHTRLETIARAVLNAA